jgi:glutamate dehydrogenase (NAD(P)+)
MNDEPYLERTILLFDRAVNTINCARGSREQLKAGIVDMLRKPQRVHHARFPVKMDSDEVRMFEGWRVQHSLDKAPTKGGLRLSPDVSLEELSALAAWMTWKTVIAGTPFTGAKGGVVCDTKKLSATELSRIIRRFAYEMSHVFGPLSDVPSPDMYTGAREMAWIYDTFTMMLAKNPVANPQAVVTGKPAAFGGLELRKEATALGGVYVLEEALRRKEIKGIDSLSGKTVTIQGFGKVGYAAARLLHEQNARIIAVSDSKGGIYSPEGLDPVAVLEYKRAAQGNSVVGYQNLAAVKRDAIQTVPCDIFIPAASQDSLTSANAEQVQAKIVLELANGPTTLEAEELLAAKGVFVIPDFVANAGGVVVSYYEWQANLSYDRETTDEVYRDRLKQQMIQTYARARETQLKYSKLCPHAISLREAGLIFGIEELHNHILERGIFP